MLELITKEQLAGLLRITTKTVDKLMREDGLPFYRIGSLYRYDLQQVKEWLLRNGKDTDGKSILL